MNNVYDGETMKPEPLKGKICTSATITSTNSVSIRILGFIHKEKLFRNNDTQEIEPVIKLNDVASAVAWLKMQFHSAKTDTCKCGYCQTVDKAFSDVMEE